MSESGQPFASPDAIWVYQSSLGGEEGVGSGSEGSSYALQTCDDEHVLLPNEEIADHVDEFRDYVTTHPDLKFRILPSSHRKSDAEHAYFADLLRNVPTNCELTGRMLEILERLKTVRIILLDANVNAVDSQARKRSLGQYFAANEGLWNAEQIEIISFGTAHTSRQRQIREGTKLPTSYCQRRRGFLRG
jgi:hypothetical protein